MFEAPEMPSPNLIDPENPVVPPPPPPNNYGAPLMYASMGLSAIGAIVTAFGESSAATAQGEYEAGIARTNATIAGVQAKQVLEAGNSVALQKNKETRAVVGSLRARQGASGIDVNVGSPAAVRASIAGQGTDDELTIRNNAARQAWGFQTEAIEDTYKGQFARLTAKSKSNQSLLNGGLSALSGPLSIEANYQRFARYMDKYRAGSNDIPFPGIK